jgi:hypothetical protein
MSLSSCRPYSRPPCNSFKDMSIKIYFIQVPVQYISVHYQDSSELTSWTSNQHQFCTKVQGRGSPGLHTSSWFSPRHRCTRQGLFEFHSTLAYALVEEAALDNEEWGTGCNAQHFCLFYAYSIPLPLFLVWWPFAHGFYLVCKQGFPWSPWARSLQIHCQTYLSKNQFTAMFWLSSGKMAWSTFTCLSGAKIVHGPLFHLNILHDLKSSKPQEPLLNIPWSRTNSNFVWLRYQREYW